MSRVLVVDQEPPQAGRDGGSARMVTLLRLLRREGYEVAFACLRPWPADLALAEQSLVRLGVAVVARDGAVANWLCRNGADLDIVVASRLPVAQAVLPLTRRHCANTRFLYDATHVEHLAKYRLAKVTGSRPLLVAALRDRAAERDVVAASDGAFATSDEDVTELRALVDGAQVYRLPAVDVDVHPDEAWRSRSGIVFLGFLGMPENEIAVRRLVHGVWPMVEAEIGPTPLTVIGATPPEWLVDAAKKRPGLVVTGQLTEIDQALRAAAVFVVPLIGGSGVKTKVLQAFAHHVPVVATADGLRGIPAVDDVHVLRAESDAELAAATVRILRDPDLGRALAQRAADAMRETFDSDVDRATLRKALGPVREIGARYD